MPPAVLDFVLIDHLHQFRFRIPPREHLHLEAHLLNQRAHPPYCPLHRLSRYAYNFDHYFGNLYHFHLCSLLCFCFYSHASSSILLGHFRVHYQAYTLHHLQYGPNDSSPSSRSNFSLIYFFSSSMTLSYQTFRLHGTWLFLVLVLHLFCQLCFHTCCVVLVRHALS